MGRGLPFRKDLPSKISTSNPKGALKRTLAPQLAILLVRVCHTLLQDHQGPRAHEPRNQLRIEAEMSVWRVRADYYKTSLESLVSSDDAADRCA